MKNKYYDRKRKYDILYPNVREYFNMLKMDDKERKRIAKKIARKIGVSFKGSLDGLEMLIESFD